MSQNNIIINGLCRSGNHAIIFWMLHNITDNLIEIEKGIYKDKSNKILYINNVGRKPREYVHAPSLLFNEYTYFFRSYEDSYYNKHTNIIILRDFVNMLCSRYEKYGPNIGLNKTYICYIDQLISVWKQHAKTNKAIIKYNSWITDKEYRNHISKNINIPNIKDKHRYISKIGDGSSFNDCDYTNRYKKVKLPEYMVERILIDKELLLINKNLFNIDIEKIFS